MISYIIIIAGLIGILTWQVIVIIIYGIIILLNKGDPQRPDELALKFAICIPYFILVILKGVDHILGYFLLSWCRKHFYKYALCYKVCSQDGKFREGNVVFFATKKMVGNLSFDSTRDYYVKFIGNCTNVKRVPYGYEIYKGQGTYQDWDMNLFRKEIKVKEKKENVYND